MTRKNKREKRKLSFCCNIQQKQNVTTINKAILKHATRNWKFPLQVVQFKHSISWNTAQRNVKEKQLIEGCNQPSSFCRRCDRFPTREIYWGSWRKCTFHIDKAFYCSFFFLMNMVDNKVNMRIRLAFNLMNKETQEPLIDMWQGPLHEGSWLLTCSLQHLTRCHSLPHRQPYLFTQHASIN